MMIYRHEISGSFYSWRGSIWIIAAALIFSLVAYLLLTDKELSLLDQGEMQFTMTEIVLALALLMTSVIASTSISSEIEAGTFESLLLTPIKQSQIAAQKFLSIMTIWAVFYAVSIPYLVVVSNGTNSILSIILFVGLYGTLIVAGLAMISISISWKMRSLKNSLMTTLMFVLLMLAPPIFFGTSLGKNDFGKALEYINPISHAINSLDSVLVDNEQLPHQQISHIWPIVAFVLISTVIFVTCTRHYEFKSLE